jgi:hypothetical protein
MYHSSKRNPCAICGRDVDDKCRNNGELFLCYHGTSFYPPDLSVGETIEIEGLGTMACLDTAAGFSGASMLLARSRPAERLLGGSGGGDRDRVARLAVLGSIGAIRKGLISLNKMPDPFSCTLEEIDFIHDNARKIYETSDKIEKTLREKRTSWSNIKKVYDILLDSKKQAGYTLKHIQDFKSRYLGC